MMNSIPLSFKKRSVLFLLLFGFQMSVFAQDADAMFTIYLVRHAEKVVSEDKPRDPPLTPCGEQRAASLEVFLSSVHLDAIYSSDYIRTRNTAQRTATNRQMETRLYDPKKLEEFAKLLIERGEDALVVGHSNSTPVLAGLLVGEEMDPIDESIYNRIYQVVISNETGRLHVLHSTFDCVE
jgi:broad specificity phosphatase PhoE